MAELTTGARGAEARTPVARTSIVQGPTKAEVRASRVLSVCCVALLCVLGACNSPTPIRGGEYTANYSGATLSGTIQGARVPSVIAATEQAMLARGYSIVETASTEESGQIIGRPPRYNNYPRMKVGAAQVGDGVRVNLTYEPFGDREVCAAMYDAILRRLGK